VSFPRGVWAALAVVGLLQVGGILTQLLVVEDQRRTVRDQLDIAQQQRRDSEPLVDQAKPLVHAALQDLPKNRRLARQMRRLARHARPVVEELDSAPLGSSIRAGTRLAVNLLSADLPETARTARWLSAELLSMLAAVRDEQLVPKAARAAEIAPQLLQVQRRTLRLQRRALRVQLHALDRMNKTLAVARETERHAESIDRKTGGELPAP
jgi:hypothetical protein